jgi:hypothetical protein
MSWLQVCIKWAANQRIPKWSWVEEQKKMKGDEFIELITKKSKHRMAFYIGQKQC